MREMASRKTLIVSAYFWVLERLLVSRKRIRRFIWCDERQMFACLLHVALSSAYAVSSQ